MWISGQKSRHDNVNMYYYQGDNVLATQNFKFTWLVEHKIYVINKSYGKNDIRILDIRFIDNQ